MPAIRMQSHATAHARASGASQRLKTLAPGPDRGPAPHRARSLLTTTDHASSAQCGADDGHLVMLARSTWLSAARSISLIAARTRQRMLSFSNRWCAVGLPRRARRAGGTGRGSRESGNAGHQKAGRAGHESRARAIQAWTMAGRPNSSRALCSACSPSRMTPVLPLRAWVTVRSRQRWQGSVPQLQPACKPAAPVPASHESPARCAAPGAD